MVEAVEVPITYLPIDLRAQKRRVDVTVPLEAALAMAQRGAECGQRWKVVRKTTLRAGIEADAEAVADLGVGQVVILTLFHGRHAKAITPANGWVSLQTSSGDRILGPVAADGEMVTGAEVHEHALLLEPGML